MWLLFPEKWGGEWGGEKSDGSRVESDLTDEEKGLEKGFFPLLTDPCQKGVILFRGKEDIVTCSGTIYLIPAPLFFCFIFFPPSSSSHLAPFLHRQGYLQFLP